MMLHNDMKCLIMVLFHFKQFLRSFVEKVGMEKRRIRTKQYDHPLSLNVTYGALSHASNSYEQEYDHTLGMNVTYSALSWQ